MDDAGGILGDPVVAWRAVVLYGLNTATYKVALAACLRDFAQAGQARVPLDDLAAAFFDLYADRLASGQPQLATPGRLTEMERIVAAHRLGRIDRGEAIARVGERAFGDVLPRFHTVFDRPLPVPFYEALPDGGIVLTDAAFRAAESPEAAALGEKFGARWDLLEAAFALRREDGELANDVRAIYLARGYERTPVTRLRPVLHAYQEGRCFYCGEPIPAGTGDVDHVLPRQVLMHDEPWNLVLAHSACNPQKLDRVPGLRFVEQLVSRNEHLIASNHPLRGRVLVDLGRTPRQRREATLRAYHDAKTVVRWEWDGLPGFEPATSAFYKAIVREVTR